MPRVIINSEPIVSRKSGIGYYTYNLLKELIKLKEIEEDLDIALMLKEVYSEDTLRDLRADEILYIKPITTGLLNYDRAKFIGIEGIFLRLSFGDDKYDVYHEPNHILLDIDARKKVLTIHDLATIYVPQFHPMSRVAFFKRRLSESVHKADMIIAVSEFTKRTIVEYFGVDQDKVKTIYNGFDPSRFHVYPRKEIKAKLELLGLPDNYVLFLGTIEPRKNLSGLLMAHDNLPVYIRREFPLVVVGGLGWKYATLKEGMDKKARNKELIYLGYVDDIFIPYLYAGARVFSYLSFFEGFGLPVLEAMACGTPVVASNATSIPEVSGNAALLVDPKDIDGISEALLSLIEDGTLREKCRVLGFERARLFSWKKAAEDTAAIYRSLI